MPEPVCWIDDIDYRDANLSLRTIYDQVLSPDGQLDNLYRGFSLSPQTILPADTLYKAALHHSNNVLSKDFAELIGTYVAILTGCDYARAHHGHNFVTLSEDADQALRLVDALSNNSADTVSGDTADALNDRSAEAESCDESKMWENIAQLCTRQQATALSYVRKLCLRPAHLAKDDIIALRESGWNDAEISEIVQVVAMFSYFVRVINGVGIQLGDEKIGLY